MFEGRLPNLLTACVCVCFRGRFNGDLKDWWPIWKLRFNFFCAPKIKIECRVWFSFADQIEAAESRGALASTAGALFHSFSERNVALHTDFMDYVFSHVLHLQIFMKFCLVLCNPAKQNKFEPVRRTTRYQTLKQAFI